MILYPRSSIAEWTEYSLCVLIVLGSNPVIGTFTFFFFYYNFYLKSLFCLPILKMQGNFFLFFIFLKFYLILLFYFSVFINTVFRVPTNILSC